MTGRAPEGRIVRFPRPRDAGRRCRLWTDGQNGLGRLHRNRSRPKTSRQRNTERRAGLGRRKSPRRVFPRSVWMSRARVVHDNHVRDTRPAARSNENGYFWRSQTVNRAHITLVGSSLYRRTRKLLTRLWSRFDHADVIDRVNPPATPRPKRVHSKYISRQRHRCPGQTDRSNRSSWFVMTRARNLMHSRLFFLMLISEARLYRHLIHVTQSSMV